MALALPGALAVWLTATVLLVSPGWYLACEVHGQKLGGIDCLQANALPRTNTTPARWFGFLPLAGAWTAATLVMVVARRGRPSQPSACPRSAPRT
jgi:hypothetical protein